MKYQCLKIEGHHTDGKAAHVADKHQVKVLQLQWLERLLLHGLKRSGDVSEGLGEADLLHLTVLGGKDLLVWVRLEHPPAVPEHLLAQGELVWAGDPVLELKLELLLIDVVLVADDAVAFPDHLDEAGICNNGRNYGNVLSNQSSLDWPELAGHLGACGDAIQNVASRPICKYKKTYWQWWFLRLIICNIKLISFHIKERSIKSTRAREKCNIGIQ